MAKFFENSLPSDRWHKTLVDRMALEIPGVRPALFPDGELKSEVSEVLRFRHKFTNLYGEDLDPDKTMEVQRAMEHVLETFPDRANRPFCEKLRAIAERL